MCCRAMETTYTSTAFRVFPLSYNEEGSTKQQDRVQAVQHAVQRTIRRPPASRGNNNEGIKFGQSTDKQPKQPVLHLIRPGAITTPANDTNPLTPRTPHSQLQPRKPSRDRPQNHPLPIQLHRHHRRPAHVQRHIQRQATRHGEAYEDPSLPIPDLRRAAQGVQPPVVFEQASTPDPQVDRRSWTG